MVVSNAFNRWMVRCMAAAGEKDMTAMDVALLHHVNHLGRKKLADICFCAQYRRYARGVLCLEKTGAGGPCGQREDGKEVLFSTTAGMALRERYREVRERCLIGALVESGASNAEIGNTAQLLRALRPV